MPIQMLNPADYVLIARADLDVLRAAAARPAPTNGHQLRVSQVAATLALSRAAVYRLIEAGDLRAVTIGRAVRVHPDDVEVFIQQRRSGSCIQGTLR
jgi:excisionase family DNA binding protein